jgi:hypothetical protein
MATPQIAEGGNMARRRLHFCWPHHAGPWHHARPSREEEKQSLADYIATLKEELQDAEEYLKELEAGK